MAVRDDIDILWGLSPRLVLIDAASDEVIMQDLHDTLTEREARPENLIYSRIVSSAGKEALGGGVTVGITTTLQDARLGWYANKSWVSQGTVTTPDATGRVLVDSAATFISDGVEPGCWLINLTDGSICTVLTVDSETQVTTDTLGAGSDNQWDSADAYRVMLVDQKGAVGGNLVAVDAVQAELDPILPTAGNQVVRTASSSATLQELLDIQYASFNGGVTIDVANGVAGTAYPIGTPRLPSNNTSDTLAIAATRGFNKIYVRGGLTLGAGDAVSGYQFEGQSPGLSTVTVGAAATVTNTTFMFLTVDGTLDGNCEFNQCHVLDLDFFSGIMKECLLEGTVTLGGGVDAEIVDSSSGVPGTATPFIDFGNTGQSLLLRNYNGGIGLINKSGTDACSIDMSSGQVVLNNTLTAGTITVRGVAYLFGKADAEGAGATINDQLLNVPNITDGVWGAQTVDHTVAGSFGRLIADFKALLNAILGNVV